MQRLAFRDPVRASLERQHLYFLGTATVETLARWHWKGAREFGRSPVAGALAIGALDEPGACLIDEPFTPAGRDWLARHPQSPNVMATSRPHALRPRS